tara:strand:- start:2025 stop:2810 length:786 start_codon:yes stop_codon:yes gene_type:complete
MTENSKKFRILLPLLGGLLSVILVLSGAIYIFFNINFLSNKEIQLIKAPEGPIKEKPENSGGKIIDHLDAEFYGILDKDIENKFVEVLKPPAPEPELPVLELDLKTIKVQDNSETINESDNKSFEIYENDSFDNQTKELELTSQNKDNISLEKKNFDSIDDNNSDILSLKIENPISKPKKGYFVQLASFNNEEKAKVSVDILNEKLAVSLNGNQLQIMKVDLGDGKGIWWRIVTDIINRSEAETICALLKSEGNNCIVRSK